MRIFIPFLFLLLPLFLNGQPSPQDAALDRERLEAEPMLNYMMQDYKHSLRAALEIGKSTTKAPPSLQRDIAGFHPYAEKAIDHLESLRKRLGEFGKRGADGLLANPTESSLNADMWGLSEENGGRGNKEAKALWQKLGVVDRYVREIAAGSAAISMLPLNADAGATNWARAHFDRTTVVKDLHFLTHLEIRLLLVTRLTLDWLVAKGSQPKADPHATTGAWSAVLVPLSRILLPGMRYEAMLFPALATMTLPEFSGQGVSVEPGGQTARLRLEAQPGFPRGATEKMQSFQALIRVPRADGSFEELNVQDSFSVVSPELEVHLSSDNTLYTGCGNSIILKDPGYGELFNPVFGTDSGTLIKNPNAKGAFVLMPLGPYCTVDVATNIHGRLFDLGMLQFGVMDPPPPTLGLKLGTNPHNGQSEVAHDAKVSVVLYPDERFQSALPKDARYRIGMLKLYALRDGALEALAEMPGADLYASSGIPVPDEWITAAHTGKMLLLQVEDVVRINFRNEAVPQDMPPASRSILFKVK